MNKDDLISEFVGAYANVSKINQISIITKNDFYKILKIVISQDQTGSNNKMPKDIINDAVQYWETKDRKTVVENINSAFPVPDYTWPC